MRTGGGGALHLTNAEWNNGSGRPWLPATEGSAPKRRRVEEAPATCAGTEAGFVYTHSCWERGGERRRDGSGEGRTIKGCHAFTPVLQLHRPPAKAFKLGYNGVHLLLLARIRCNSAVQAGHARQQLHLCAVRVVDGVEALLLIHSPWKGARKEARRRCPRILALIPLCLPSPLISILSLTPYPFSFHASAGQFPSSSTHRPLSLFVALWAGHCLEVADFRRDLRSRTTSRPCQSPAPGGGGLSPLIIIRAAVRQARHDDHRLVV